jgi:hypothetical protein
MKVTLPSTVFIYDMPSKRVRTVPNYAKHLIVNLHTVRIFRKIEAAKGKNASTLQYITMVALILQTYAVGCTVPF